MSLRCQPYFVTEATMHVALNIECRSSVNMAFLRVWAMTKGAPQNIHSALDVTMSTIVCQLMTWRHSSSHIVNNTLPADDLATL